MFSFLKIGSLIKLGQVCVDGLFRKLAFKRSEGPFCVVLFHMEIVCVLRREDHEEKKRVGIVFSRGLVVSFHAWLRHVSAVCLRERPAESRRGIAAEPSFGAKGQPFRSACETPFREGESHPPVLSSLSIAFHSGLYL